MCMMILLLSVASLLLQPCLSRTILVDGISEWKNPTVLVGDTIIFRHKHGYDLYIFRNKDAFSRCDFTQATVLTSPNSKNFTWYPSRPGFFYFTFRNATHPKPTASCAPSRQKLPIHVLTGAGPGPSPSPMTTPTPSPAPKSGGAVSSSPSSYPWPEGPKESTSSAEGPAPNESTTVTVPKKGVPFINSNPAVPLPTGEVDSVTINPLPIVSSSNYQALGVGLPSSVPVILLSTALLL